MAKLWGLRVWYGRRDSAGVFHCIMPECQSFASTAAVFKLHMKKKHGVEVEVEDLLQSTDGMNRPRVARVEQRKAAI